MKACPSCGSELADDARECLCGYSYDENEEENAEVEVEQPLDSDESAEDEVVEAEEVEAEVGEPEFSLPEFTQAEGPATKPCVFCLSEIAAPAMRCPHCSGFLPIAEGSIFKQYFFFLFASLAIALGALLPWEREFYTGNLTGVDSIAGGFMFLFAVYGVIVSIWNIYHRKMIVWPVLLAAVDGAIIGWRAVLQMWSGAEAKLAEIIATKYPNIEGFDKMRLTLKTHLTHYGPGLYLVVIFSTIVILSTIISVFKGAKQDAQRKSEEREARAASRRTRR